MSSSTIPELTAAVTDEQDSLRSLVVRPVEGAAFWAAVALPFLHLPLLATGLESPSITLAFLLLVGLNVFALLVGHRHGRD